MAITQVHFAKLAGITRKTVDHRVKDGTLIKQADGRMDENNEKNKKYLQARMKAKKEADAKPKLKPETALDKEIQDFSNLATLEQQLKVDKLNADVSLKMLMLKEKRGELVSKNKLSDVCFSYIDLLNKNLLVIPQVFLDRVENYIKHNKDKKGSKKEMMNEISAYITKAVTTTKKQVERKLKSKYDIENEV